MILYAQATLLSHCGDGQRGRKVLFVGCQAQGGRFRHTLTSCLAAHPYHLTQEAVVDLVQYHKYGGYSRIFVLLGVLQQPADPNGLLVHYSTGRQGARK